MQNKETSEKETTKSSVLKDLDFPEIEKTNSLSVKKDSNNVTVDCNAVAAVQQTDNSNLQHSNKIYSNSITEFINSNDIDSLKSHTEIYSENSLLHLEVINPSVEENSEKSSVEENAPAVSCSDSNSNMHTEGISNLEIASEIQPSENNSFQIEGIVKDLTISEIQHSNTDKELIDEISWLLKCVLTVKLNQMELTEKAITAIQIAIYNFAESILNCDEPENTHKIRVDCEYILFLDNCTIQYLTDKDMTSAEGDILKICLYKQDTSEYSLLIYFLFLLIMLGLLLEVKQ